MPGSGAVCFALSFLAVVTASGPGSGCPFRRDDRRGFLDALSVRGSDALVDGQCLLQAGGRCAGVAVVEVAVVGSFQGACCFPVGERAPVKCPPPGARQAQQHDPQRHGGGNRRGGLAGITGLMEAAGPAAASSRLAEVEPADLMETGCAGLWLRWRARPGPAPPYSRPWMPA
jgi:hypothetical protein